MATNQETNLAAVIESPTSRITVKSLPIPAPGPLEILVRNHAIAVNPVDWLIQDFNWFVNKYPTVLGSDVCGLVSAVGSRVSKFKVGDRVTGFAGVIYSSQIENGAFQTYTIIRENATTKLPDFMSFEEGAVFPMAIATAALGLFVNLSIPRPKSSSPSSEKQTSAILIWGAASSVGSIAVQVARNLGFYVLATASPVHHEYIKTLGASEVFDYKQPDVEAKLIEAAKQAGFPITHGFDAVSKGDTFSQMARILTASGGQQGKLTLVLPWPEAQPKPDGITISQIVALSLGGEQAEFSTWLFNGWFQDNLDQKTIVPSPKIEVIEGGVNETQLIFDAHKAGVSGKKLVLRVT